jgi:hypothetical protein
VQVAPIIILPVAQVAWPSAEKAPPPANPSDTFLADRSINNNNKKNRVYIKMYKIPEL